MTSRRTIAVAMLAALTALPAGAHDPETIALQQLAAHCASQSLPAEACAAGADAIRASFSATKRTGGGVSYMDARNENHHSGIVVEVGSFSFAPRVLEVDFEQVVTFVNVSPPGGDRHRVASSDWMGSERAMPVPGLSFGGGTGFDSDLMQPGDSWDLAMVIQDWPESIVPLGISKVLIPYHCNIHGASQMSGFLLLRTDEY